MLCIGCMKKSGNYASQLCLCDVCQWNIYGHIREHSTPGRRQYNYDELDWIKKNIAEDARHCPGDDIVSYLENNSSTFRRFRNAISASDCGGDRYQKALTNCRFTSTVVTALPHNTKQFVCYT